MNSSQYFALTSWAIQPGPAFLLLLAACIYLRGWVRMRRLYRAEGDAGRLAAYLAGLGVLFIATESPLDSFDTLYLSAHMTQHLLLMMVAPPLILLARPTVPLLRGLPKALVKEGLAPFLQWQPLKRVFGLLVAPVTAWTLFAISTIGWHLPAAYELALHSPFWHGLQHASFFWTGILFWWPIVRPLPGKSKWPEWIGIPYLLFADIVNTVISAFFIFSGRLLYPSYSAIQLSGLTARDDQTIAGAIMWVPGSLIYLIPAIVLTMRVLSGSGQRTRERGRIVSRRKHVSSLKRWHLPELRRAAQWGMLVCAIAVIADGLRGPQITPVNLAGVLPWIHWRALSLIALLAIGNLFCMACPFTLARDLARKVLPAKWRWPRALRSKWLPAILFVIYLWAYEAFNLWDSPAVTAWIIIGYLAGAIAVDGLFRGASFCKYVCPIGQFHFVTSLVSPREVTVRRQGVCESCRTHDCIRGNENARGCELYLFQPKKAGNLDCTFCLDCVKACPHDNVSLVSIAPAKTITADPYRSSIGRLSKRVDLMVMALLVVFGAFVNAAGMVSPVMMWEHRWHARLGAHAMPLVVGVFVAMGLVVAPAIAISLCAAANRLSGGSWRVARRFAFTLVPLGVAMWAAHLSFHFVTGWAAPWAAVNRLVTGVAIAISPADPAWLPGMQMLLLDAGLLLTLYVAWRIAKQQSDRLRTAIAMVAPWMLLSCALYGAGIWILLQPMQMRGMMH